MNKLLYKENLDENKLLKSRKSSLYIVYLVLVFYNGLLSWLYVIYLIIFLKDDIFDIILFTTVGTMAWIMGFLFRKMAIRIRPLEVYDDGFIWPYYNWPTDDGFVRWDDVRMIVLNVKGFPDFIFVSIGDVEKKIVKLKKYAVNDMRKFLSIAESEGIKVVEDEIRFRDLGKLRPQNNIWEQEVLWYGSWGHVFRPRCYKPYFRCFRWMG